MKEYPLEKYKFIHVEKEDGRHKIIALSTYAGKPIRGVAVCSVEDEFDLEFGKRLAAARCNFKVAQKREERVWDKVWTAKGDIARAKARYERARDDYDEARKDFNAAALLVDDLLTESRRR